MSNSKELFIFPEAVHRLPEIDDWLSREPDALFSIARQWFTTFLWRDWWKRW